VSAFGELRLPGNRSTVVGLVVAQHLAWIGLSQPKLGSSLDINELGIFEGCFLKP
jgi:hypothetical protein